MHHSQRLRSFRNKPRLIALSLTCFLLTGATFISESALAKQWPVQQTPTEAPVPQYVPGTSSRPVAQSPEQTRPAAQPVGQLPDFFDRSSQSPIPNDQLLAPNPLAKPTASVVQVPSNRPAQPIQAPSQAPSVTAPSPDGLPGTRVMPPTAIEPAIPLSAPARPRQINKKKSDEQAKTKPHRPLLDETIFRDYSAFPIDPRKPCSQCTQGRGQCSCGIGNQGRPYQEKLYGGCRCDSCRSTKHPDFSVHWPRPFSAKLDQRHPEWEAERHSGCPQKRIVDVFDSLSTFKLLNYKRTDNGYCGPGSDPYGCLGESKLRAAVHEYVGPPIHR